MASFVLQALGCDVSAINTVHFSNHTAYKQWTGTKVPAELIQELYDGLKGADLAHFDMMLSGYVASKDAVDTVGGIARDLRLEAQLKPGSFFWALDPVMGDEGRIYVAEDIVPAYRGLLREADLILPNAFEAELLSETKIVDMTTLISAITKLHNEHKIPHIVVTSIRLPQDGANGSGAEEPASLQVVGSSCRSDGSPRIFSITTPSLPIFFSGTGDMFSALTLLRLREASAQFQNGEHALLAQSAWRPPDDVPASSLPLARATERALASMHVVLTKTARVRAEELGGFVEPGADAADEDKRLDHLRRTRASEVRVVKFADDLRRIPRAESGVRFTAVDINLQGGIAEE